MFRFDPPQGSAIARPLMANGEENGNGNGALWKGLTPWMRFIGLIGIPGAIALAVVWSDRQQLVTRLDAQSIAIEQLKDDAKGHYERDGILDQAILDATRETNRIVLAECLNNAKRNPSPGEAWDRCIGR